MRKTGSALLALLTLLTLTASADVAPRVRLPRPKRGFQMRMGKFTIPPAHEREVCEFRTFPNRKPIDAQALEFKMSPGSHHFAIWAYLGQDRNAADFPKTIVDSPGCIGVGPSDTFNRALLGGAGSPHATTRFPPGIALRLAAHAPVILNSHYINGSATDPLTPSVVFNVTRAKASTVRHHAEQLTIGNTDIAIPALGTASLTSDWAVPYPMNVIQLSSHEHKRGTRVTIHLLRGGQDTGQIFENVNWNEPYELWPSPPIRVEPGDVFRFTCEWKNNDDHPVSFGVTTNDEMCFMTGYFYRDDESVAPPQAPHCLLQESGLLCFAPTVP